VTSLRSIIAAFLADLTCAQHRANLLSEKLSWDYRNHTLLRFFPVPNALLEEAEVTLRFAVDSTETEDGACGRMQRATVLPISRVLVADAAGEIAVFLQEALAERLMSCAAAEHRKALVERLQRELRSLRLRLIPGLESAVLLQSSRPDEGAFRARTHDALRQALLGLIGADEDLATVTDSVPALIETVLAGPVGEHAFQSLERVVASGSAIAEEASAFPATRVIVSAADLGGFPDYAVHSLRLKARLRNYKWVITREGDPAGDQLLPEN
jgi:hypothetical protein